MSNSKHKHSWKLSQAVNGDVVLSFFDDVKDLTLFLLTSSFEVKLHCPKERKYFLNTRYVPVEEIMKLIVQKICIKVYGIFNFPSLPLLRLSGLFIFLPISNSV